MRVLDGGVLEALAVGNAELPEGYRMDRAAVAWEVRPEAPSGPRRRW